MSTNPFIMESTSENNSNNTAGNYNTHIIHDTQRKYSDLVEKYLRQFENVVKNGEFRHDIREDRFHCKIRVEKLDDEYIDKNFIVGLEKRLEEVDNQITAVYITAEEKTGCCGSKKSSIRISYREKN